MELFFQIILGIVVCASVMAVIWSVKGILLTPVKSRKNTKVYTVIKVTGDAEGLEQTVKGLMWLRDAGRVDTDVVIVQWDVDEAAQKKVEKLAEGCLAAVCRQEDILKVLEEGTWREAVLPQ